MNLKPTIAADQTASTLDRPAAASTAGRGPLRGTALIAATPIASASPIPGRAGVASIRAAAIDRITHTVGCRMAEPTRKAETLACVGRRASVGAGCITACPPPGLAPVRAQHQHVASCGAQPDSDDKGHGAGHLGARSGEFARKFRTNSKAVSSHESCPFIEHSSRMWNLGLGRFFAA